jgi:hypothetical protein
VVKFKWGESVVRTVTIVTLLAIFQSQQIAIAQEFPKPPSVWYAELKSGEKVVDKFCLQIKEPLVPIGDPRTTPRKCAAISATIVAASHTDLVSGYFCEDQSEVGFFTLPPPSDNSLSGPNFFFGKLHIGRVTGAYYVIESNDVPSPYAGVMLDFVKVEKCAL